MILSCDMSLTCNGFSLQFKHDLSCKSISAITGKSGSGKTTLLRWIAGFERVEHAQLTFNDTVLQSKQVWVQPEQRPIVYVGQTLQLFPFLSAQKNIDFARKRVKQSHYAAPNLETLIDLFDINSCLDKKPAILSSGEKQRVSLLQALMNCPQILLLDEALSAIDVERKNLILDYLVNYCLERKITVLFVSHDMREIERVTDNVISIL